MNWNEIKVGDRYQLTRVREIEEIPQTLIGIRVQSKEIIENRSGKDRRIKGILFSIDGTEYNTTINTVIDLNLIHSTWMSSEEEQEKIKLHNKTRQELRDTVIERCNEIKEILNESEINSEVSEIGIKIEINAPYGDINNISETIENLNKLINLLKTI